MIQNPAAAHRYARALFAAAKAAGVEEAAGEALGALGAAFGKDAATVARLENPAVPRARKERSLAEAVARLPIDARTASLLTKLLSLLLKRHRIALLGEVAEAYGEILDEARGITRVRVRSAVPLSDDARARLERALASRAGGPVRASYEVDESLVGGCVAEVGGLRIDGSVAGRLERARRRLLTA